MTKEQLFNSWIETKEDIQMLAGIVQNDIQLTEEDLLSWLERFDEFKLKLQNLQIKTVRMVRLK